MEKRTAAYVASNVLCAVVRGLNGVMRTSMPHEYRDYPVSPKQQSAERWAQRRLGRLDHERRVAAIASTLFDLTHARHRLGTPEKRLLFLGAALHDVGKKVNVKRHPTIGARMILSSASLPLSGTE